MIRARMDALALKSVTSTWDVVRGRSLPCYWSASKETKRNFGDDLNRIIVPWLVRKPIMHYNSFIGRWSRGTYFFIGSTLDNLRISKAIVFGAGFKRDSAKIYSDSVEVLALRGPRSHKVFKRHGVCAPEVFCDPGLFIRDVAEKHNIDMSQDKVYDVGLIPHYVDKPLLSKIKLTGGQNVKIIDIEASWESVVKEITKCRAVASSSLHGIIAAHSLGLPAAWIVFSDRIAGGDFKFRDYYESLSVLKPRCIKVDGALSLDDVCENADLPKVDILKNEYLCAINRHFHFGYE